MHYAALQNLHGVNDVLDAYKAGDADFHTIVADMAEIPRIQAKTINVRSYATCPEQWKNKDFTWTIVQGSFMGTKSVRDS